MIKWQLEKFGTSVKSLFFKIVGRGDKVKRTELSRRLKTEIETKFKMEINDSHYIVFDKIDPIYLRRNSSDIHVFEEIYLRGEYESVIKTLIYNNIEINLIVDIGGNIGLASRYFYNDFPEAQFICIEPDLENFKMMLKNLNCIEKLLTYNCAIWSEETQLKIHNHFRDGQEWSLSVTQDVGTVGKNVSAITLDRVINENKLSQIDLLKIDIEGAEFELFRGNYSNFLSYVKVIIIEVHPEVGEISFILDKLKSSNFLIYIDEEVVIGFNLKKF